MTATTADDGSLGDVTVVVTGAAGFVGSFVTAHLADCGAQVIAVDGPDPGHRPHLTQALRLPSVTHIETPRRWPYRTEPGVSVSERFQELVPFLATADAVIHFAYAKPRPLDASRANTGVEELAAEISLNVAPSLELLQMLGSGVRSFCFASSGLVYGHGHSRPVTEGDHAHGDTAYGLGKLAVEQAVTAWSTDPETGCGTSLRIPTVYGPGETAPRAVPNFIRRGLAGQPPQIEIAEDRRDYIAAADVASGTAAVVAWHLAERQAAARHTAAPQSAEPVNTVLNIATGTTYSTLEVANIVLDHLGVDIEPLVGSGSRPPLQHELDATRLRALTGWRPTVRLGHGVAGEVDWFRARPELWG